jgi:Protein of unknown function (DUF2892)
MKTNIGVFDRLLRMSMAVTALILYFKGIVSGPPGLIMIAIAMVLAFTSLVGLCPIYSLLGMSTCFRKKASK